MLVQPGPLKAQAAQPESPPPRVTAAAAFLVETGEVAGAREIMFGGWGGMVFGDRFILGGGGVALPERVEISGSEAATGFDLGMGFGGVYMRYAISRWGPLAAEGGLLLGAGHAEVRDRFVGLEVGADNFMILAPEAGFTLRVFRALQLAAFVGYRYVWGVDDLPLLSSEDFRSVSGAFSVRVGGA